jgi:Protein of unknown function (DUF2911)
MKSLLTFAGALLAAASFASAQESPSQTAVVTIAARTIGIDYSAPSVKGREGKLFGKDGRIGKDRNYPVWRAGANAATRFHTDADLDVGGLAVPKGDYTLYVNLADPDNWELIVNKQTGQWGLTYDPSRDLGRVKMNMSKPAAMIETLKYTLADEGGSKVRLRLEWEDHVASVPIAVK